MAANDIFDLLSNDWNTLWEMFLETAGNIKHC